MSLKVSGKENSKVVIRKLTVDYIEQVIKIAQETGLTNWSAESYIKVLNKEETSGFLIIINEKVIGFILLRVLLDEVEILNFSISEAYQKKGFGKTLFDAAVQDVKKSWKAENIWLEVRESNFRAIQFYEKQGFEIIYKRKNFYAQPSEDAFVMKLEI